MQRTNVQAIAAMTACVVGLLVAPGCSGDSTGESTPVVSEACLVRPGYTVRIERDSVDLPAGFPLTIAPASTDDGTQWAEAPGVGGGRWVEPKDRVALDCIPQDQVPEITDKAVRLCRDLFGDDTATEGLAVGRIAGGKSVETVQTDGAPIGSNDQPWVREVGDTTRMGGVRTSRRAVAVAMSSC